MDVHQIGQLLAVSAVKGAHLDRRHQQASSNTGKESEMTTGPLSVRYGQERNTRARFLHCSRLPDRRRYHANDRRAQGRRTPIAPATAHRAALDAAAGQLQPGNRVVVRGGCHRRAGPAFPRPASHRKHVRAHAGHRLGIGLLSDYECPCLTARSGTISVETSRVVRLRRAVATLGRPAPRPLTLYFKAS